MSPIQSSLAASLILSLLALFAPSAAGQDQNFHIYLALGQSNMVGATKIEADQPSMAANLRMLQSIDCADLGREYGEWYPAAPPLFGCGGGIGLADSFLEAMAIEAPAGVVIGIVPTAIAGSDIALFQKTAPIGRGGGGETRIPPQFDGGYAWLLDLAQRAQRVGVIKGIIFHQGETNAGDEGWKLKVQRLVADLRADLGSGEIPFVAGELLTLEADGCCGFHNYQIWELPQLIPNAFVVSAAGLTGFDNAHFTPESYAAFGRRYASIMAAAVAAREPDDAAPANVGCGSTGSRPNCCGTRDGASDSIWGYQIGQTCVFDHAGNGQLDPQAPQSFSCGAIGSHPICCSGAFSDPDGDSWGWEDSRSCLVAAGAEVPGSVTPASADSCGELRGRPICCHGAESDPDGDGWGWEGLRSCLVAP